MTQVGMNAKANNNTIAWIAVGSVIGTLAALLVLEKSKTKRKFRNSGESQSESDNNDVDPSARVAAKNAAKKTPKNARNHDHCDCLSQQRERLPELILLLRHGESELHADHTLRRTKPDHQIRLTPKGVSQSREAGKRIEALFASYESQNRNQTQQEQKEQQTIRRVAVHVSPFARTLETAEAAVPFFAHRVVQTIPESRIREQETGNAIVVTPTNTDTSTSTNEYQREEADRLRREQQLVGRFWYRFPTGESGADVYDRVKSWWSESVLPTNERECPMENEEKDDAEIDAEIETDQRQRGSSSSSSSGRFADAIVVVTHSLSMRFVLMQLYGWSPHTFHSVWSSDNCDCYVLRKDLRGKGLSPYVLDRERGDVPQSSVDLWVRTTAKTTALPSSSTDTNTNTGSGSGSVKETKYTLHDYLDVPPPRKKQKAILKQMLLRQYPELVAESIESISFEPTTGVPIGKIENKNKYKNKRLSLFQ